MKTETITNQPTSLATLFAAPNPVDSALVPSAPAALPEAAVPLQLAPSSRKPRNGKIARLPKPVRDVVNRMLFQNISQDRIVSALDELGVHVNQQNVSNWKNRGGYREWRLAQEYATQLRVHQDNLIDLLRRHDAPELPEIGLQAAATQLSRFFLTPAAQQLLASDAKEYERRVSMLNRISIQLKVLQKTRDDAARRLGYHHNPDRIRHETHTSLERLTETYTSEIGDSPNDPTIPHRNLLPNPNELFDFSDRAPDDAPRTDSVVEFMKLLHQQSTPANENTAPKA